MPHVRLIIGCLIASIGLGISFALAADDPVAPAPHRIFIGQPLPPDEEGQLAEIEGTVTFVGRKDQDLQLELSSESGRTMVSVTNAPDAWPDLLLKSRVLIQGRCTGIYNDTDGTIVGSLKTVVPADISLLEVPEETWQRYPVQPISAAITNPPGKIAHIRGWVTKTGHVALHDKSGEIDVSSIPDSPNFTPDQVEELGTVERLETNVIFQCQISRMVVSGKAKPSTLPTLTKIEQIHWLKPEEAANRYPVSIRAVVTWIRPNLHNGSVQDATGAVYVRNLVPRGKTTVAEGMFCEIEGFTVSGSFAPGIECHRLTVLGPGEYPEPMRPSWEEINSGVLDVRWVEVQGVVSLITNQSLLVLMKDGRILCSVPRLTDADRYLNAVVRVRGVIVYHTDTNRNFYGEHLDVPAEHFISIETPPPNPTDLLQVRRPADLMHYHPQGTSFQRVKVAGQLVHVRDGTLFLMDGTNGFRVVPGTEPSASLVAGTLVEAIGFPEIVHPENPMLMVREAVISQVGQKPLPAAQTVSADDLPDPRHDSTLVRLQAQLINVARYNSEEVFELQTGTLVYRARLNIDEAHALPVPVGSRLDVSGVYVTGNSARADGAFELLLNSPDDLRILRRPSWWTGPHTAMVVGSLTLLLLLGSFWVAVLRLQVTRRTMQLSDANRSLRREMTERQRVEDELVKARADRLVEQERNRIARDLHDDLGSRVTRVVLMLDEFSLEKGPAPAAPDDPLPKISAAAREIIHSLDENVWAVNAGNDTVPHLIDYMGHFATDFLATANIRCRMDFPKDPPDLPLSADVRHNLFLAVKEALTNTVRHAQATEVWLRATVQDDLLTLVVEDNGKGIEADPTHPSADGLRNLRQRMDALGGRLDLQTAPHRGTKVVLAYRCPPRP